LLRGGRIPDRPLFWHFPNYTNQGGRPAAAVREGDWKLILHFEEGRIELFNLAEDAGERNDRAAVEGERAKDLQKKLTEWQTQVGAKIPVPNPEFDEELHRRLYVDQDSSRLVPGKTAEATEPAWKDWREAMNRAIRGRSPRVTPAQGDVRLLAHDARVHGTTLRYEPEPHKNVLGYWTNAADWAEWRFEVRKAGRYEVEIQQGCGTGSGGAEVDVETAGQTLRFTVQETGHFQRMILRTIGTVELAAGAHQLSVRPRTRPGPAVMDLRRVVLRPVPAGR
jgi:hypothetical protein